MTPERDSGAPQNWLAAKFHDGETKPAETEAGIDTVTGSPPPFKWGLVPSGKAAGPAAKPDSADSDGADSDGADSVFYPTPAPLQPTPPSGGLPAAAVVAATASEADDAEQTSASRAPVASPPVPASVRPFYPPPPAIRPGGELPAPVSAAGTVTHDAAAATDGAPVPPAPMTMDEVLDAPSPRRAARAAAAREDAAREDAASQDAARADAARKPAAASVAPAPVSPLPVSSTPVTATPIAPPAAGPVPLVEPTLTTNTGITDIEALLGGFVAAGSAAHPEGGPDDGPAEPTGPRGRGDQADPLPEFSREPGAADAPATPAPEPRGAPTRMSTVQKSVLWVGIALIVILGVVLVVVIAQRTGTSAALGLDSSVFARLPAMFGPLST